MSASAALPGAAHPQQKPAADASSKINNLQALRAFAALAVVFFHTGYAFPGVKPIGSFGVDVFFALSGYIMARICDKNPRYFLRRRLIRIVPPYWLLTLLLFGLAFAAPEFLRSTSTNVVELLKSLFFIPFVKESGLLQPLLFVGWSLNYEMFFYVLIWLSLLLLPKRPLLLASSAIVVLHFATMLFQWPGAAWIFWNAGYILEFPLGALAYYVAKGTPARVAQRWRWLWIALLLGSVGAFVYLQGFHRPPNRVFESSLYNLFSMLLVLCTSLISQGGWDTRVKSVILIGDASYILYLVHPYCEYSLQRLVVPHLPWLKITDPLGCVVAVCIAVAVGLLLHLFAERPALAYLNESLGGHRRSVEFRVIATPGGQVEP